MVVLIVLICLSNDISNAKPCELQEALHSINMTETAHSCKFNSMKEISTTLYIIGIVDICCQFVIFGVVMFSTEFKSEDIITGLKLIIYIAIPLMAAVFFAMTLWMLIIFGKREDNIFNFVELKTSMILSLENNYKSDNISKDDVKSWNNFFMKYDCCAVNEVTGTLNDFDKTPWCTTAGSCQDTSSQIPRTCCKSVTKEDYQNAPLDCYFSVKEGTYKSSCISRMRSLSRENINELHLSFISIFLHVCLILKVLESIVIVRFYFGIKRNNTSSAAGNTTSTDRNIEFFVRVGNNESAANAVEDQDKSSKTRL